MIRRVAIGLPTAIVVLLYAELGPSQVLAAILATWLTLSFLWGERLELTRGAQALLTAALFAVTLVLVATLLPTGRGWNGGLGRLRTGWSALAAASVVGATFRGWVIKPQGGAIATLAFSLVGLAACGGVRSGDVYAIAVALWILAAVMARRADDPGRAPANVTPRRATTIGAMLLSGSLLGGSLLVALPEAHAWAVSRILMMGRVETGFSERMALGSLRGILQSEEPVLRVQGAKTDYLRGQLYGRYDHGRWSNLGKRMHTVVPPVALPPGPAWTEVEILDDDPQHYFVPLRASEVAVATALARVDDTGIYAPIAAKPSKYVSFISGGEVAAKQVPPTKAELSTPARIHRDLVAHARQMTRGAQSTEEKLDALLRALRQRATYSLEAQLPIGRDPVIYFLEEGREGHCEYFASSMVLLARSLDIPARVVGGYRVHEKNPLTGTYIVRRRDAHAWVEAWMPERGWVTYDPTPPSGLPSGAETSVAAAVADWTGATYQRFLTWLEARSPLEVFGAPFPLILLIVAIRWLRARRARLAAAAEGDPPLPCFEELIAALEGHGVRRAPHETVEGLALRVSAGPAGLPSDLCEGLADGLRQYAAHRYGGRGERGALDAELGALTARLGALTKTSRR